MPHGAAPIMPSMLPGPRLKSWRLNRRLLMSVLIIAGLTLVFEFLPKTRRIDIEPLVHLGLPNLPGGLRLSFTGMTLTPLFSHSRCALRCWPPRADQHNSSRPPTWQDAGRFDCKAAAQALA